MNVMRVILLDGKKVRRQIRKGSGVLYIVYRKVKYEVQFNREFEFMKNNYTKEYKAIKVLE